MEGGGGGGVYQNVRSFCNFSNSIALLGIKKWLCQVDHDSYWLTFCKLIQYLSD
jgi:hypothetical protein